MAVPRISKEELKQRLEASDAASAPVVIDVRLKYPYEHSTVTLPGALRLSPAAPDFGLIPTNREVVAYDSDPEELVASRVAAELIRRGFRAAALKGGISDWVTAKFPTTAKEAPQAAPPAPGSLKG
jgi:rhodanese-related sulfurtransferase